MSNEEQIQVDGIALPQIEDEANDWLPDVAGEPQYPPYPHQVEMSNIIQNNDEFVALNTTVTGGGKTFSYSLPVLKNDMFCVVVFPTNALTKDQYQSIETLSEDYFGNKDVFTRVLTADKMQERRAELSAAEGTTYSNASIVSSTLQTANRHDGPAFVLTNPDVFTSIARPGENGYTGHTRQTLGLADVVVVDEFHQARPKGERSLLFELDRYYHSSDPETRLDKIAYLSATPDEQLADFLRNEFGRGDPEYFHWVDSQTTSKPVSQLTEEDAYRAVMPRARMTFFSSYPFKTKDQLVDNDELSARLCEFVSKGRSLIIVDGAAEVNDVYQDLRDELPQKAVEPINGMRNDNTMSKLTNADVIIGNSTLEVGVDIDNVDRLVFSGFNKSRFLQRFGRLRATNNGSPASREPKQAVCFTTAETVDAMAKMKAASRQPTPRHRLEAHITQTLGGKSDPSLYATEFAPIELFRSVRDFEETLSTDAQDAYRTASNQLVEKHCYADSDWRDVDDVKEALDKAQSPIGQAMQSYRSNNLTALIYDTRTESVKTYQIPSLLRFGDIEFLDWPQFKQRLRAQTDIDPEICETEQRYTEAYAWFYGHHSKEKRRSAEYTPTNVIQTQLEQQPRFRSPQRMNGVEISVSRNDDALKGLPVLNEHLRQDAEITAYATEGHPAELQTVYGLDEFFFTTEVANLNGNYAVATGENALYLYCHVQDDISNADRLYRQYNDM